MAQSNPWQEWDSDVVRSLNTAAESEYLNDEEKKVILFMNMARHDGPLFRTNFPGKLYPEENKVGKQPAMSDHFARI